MYVAGFVLTGGHSSRMGRDKARITFGSKFLVELVVEQVAKVSQSVALVGRPNKFRDLRFDCLPDLRPSAGPLAGLEAALASGRGDVNVITGCDMPGLQASWLRQLLETCEQRQAPCVIAKDSSGRVHPLCGVYRNTCLPMVRAALDAGQLRLLDTVKTLKAIEQPLEDLIANINTPEHWTAWQSGQLV